MSDEITEYDVKYIKLFVHSGTSIEQLISYLEDLEHERGNLFISDMVCLKLEEEER